MDIISLAYYGLICGVLGFSAPIISNKLTRLIIGIITGFIGAALLPYVKSYFDMSSY